jgi:hypothetical protein
LHALGIIWRVVPVCASFSLHLTSPGNRGR